ncbi:hypothetical protein Poli38472_001299 [Pythium oligandrum]|uniref:Uncharacterized protein n=1 Tax=Pythium oligandrum TaxID=41045 RepID=A0A8K1CVR9_PYTOL|nr:hypothetical protein Poli38472_001299 [Pythium oligandrum]|eukprot:TMW69143.1 hypothetical protein Poli38472_001299 [Pythium oligandrum]
MLAMVTKRDWSFLAPWWPVLERRPPRVILYDDIEDHAYQHFNGTLEITPVSPQDAPEDAPEYKEVWRQQCEAMELLAMVGRVDQAAWLAIIKRITVSTYSLMDWRATLIQDPNFVVYQIRIDHDDIIRHHPTYGVEEARARAEREQTGANAQDEEEEEREEQWPSELVTQLLAPFELSERCDEYQAAYAEIVKRAPSSALEDRFENMGISVTLEIRLMLANCLTSCIDAMMAKIEEGNSLFFIELVHYTFHDAILSTEWVDQWCQSKKDDGVLVSALTFSGVDQERPFLLQMLRRHLAFSLSAFLDEPKDRHGGPGTIPELCLKMPLGGYSSPGLFGLLAAQNSLNTLRLTHLFTPIGSEVDADDQTPYLRRRRRDWQWLSYVLFSSYSAGGYMTLDLADLSLTLEDIEAINEIRHAENPFPLLHPRSAGIQRNQPVQVARVEKGVEFDPIADLVGDVNNDEDTWQEALWQDSNGCSTNLPCSFYVMDDDPTKSTVDVLVPGFGVCPVDRAKMQISLASDREVACPSSPTSTASFTRELSSLRISLRPDDPDEITGLVPFIKLFKSSLDTLSVRSGFWPMINEEMLHEIVRECSELRILTLEGAILSSLQPIIDLYEVDGCEAYNLKFTRLCVAQAGDMKELLNVMVNPNSKFSQHVTYLTLEFGEVDVDTIAALVLILMLNKTIQYVTYGLPALHLAVARDRIEPFHNEAIAGIQSFVPVASRLALLSVMHRAAASDEQSVLGRMDSMVISRIFEFASEPKRRVVCLRESRGMFN